jgi:salicylate hydroxylase
VTIAVVGGGIAGVATAIALARKGLAVELFEQAAIPETVGAGVQMGPNAARALQAIDAYDAVVPQSTVPRGLLIYNGETGALIAEVPFGKRFEVRYGAPYRVAHRADLLSALLLTAARFDGIAPRYNSRVTAMAPESAGRHRLVLADGTEHLVQAVIGADGIRSTVREHLLGDGPPTPSGHRLYRALCQRAAAPRGIAADHVVLYLLPDAHAVAYEVSGGSLMNLVVVVGGGGDSLGWSAPAVRTEVLDALPRRAPILDELIAAAPSWARFTGADRPPAAEWGRGTITLVGDAAHPALPFLAQGAAMALEDAAVLGRLAGGDTPLAGVFRAYEQARQARTARLTLAARHQGILYHRSGGLRRLRDLLLRLVPGSLATERLNWLYDWRPP